ncbi:MAG: PrsW family glutamic-type intramembrane protease [Spirochaetia bacterium]|nr:PrsW family glutamic-type intramembrane protease [Spirochaetia bacterium]
MVFFSASVVWLVWMRSYGGNVSRRGLFIVFAIGIISGPVAGSLTHFLRTAFNVEIGSSIAANFFVFFLLVGPIEEVSKFIAAFISSHRRNDFSNSADGILVAVSAALGFAAGENVLYLNVYGPETTFLRLIFTNIAHVVFSVIWGYALGVVLHESASISFLIAALVIGSILHGAYDFFLLLHTVTAAIVLVAMIPALYWVMSFLRIELERNRRQ